MWLFAHFKDPFGELHNFGGPLPCTFELTNECIPATQIPFSPFLSLATLAFPLASLLSKPLFAVISFLISAMGEPLLAAYLQTLLDKLDSGQLLNFARQEGFESELKKWRSKLRQVKRVLGDAEEKQMSDREVKKWLDNLRDLAYDADDVLEDLNHKVLQRHNKSSSDSATSSSQVKELQAQIQEITSRFVDVEEEKSDLGLKERPRVRPSIISNSLPTSSLVDSSQIVGRKEDMDAILKLLDISATTKAGANANPKFGIGGWESGCKNLRTLPDGIFGSNGKLQVLGIKDCESLESFPSGVLPSTLKTLEIKNCRKLELLSEMLLSPASPERIEFLDYPNLKSLPECLCTDLTVLRIERFKPKAKLKVSLQDKLKVQIIRQVYQGLMQIKLVLGDAEEKQMNDIEVKRWLNGFLVLDCDADDVLDELDHEALLRHILIRRKEDMDTILKLWDISATTKSDANANLVDEFMIRVFGTAVDGAVEAALE
ncbi:Rx, N-terminal [Dillenia turbinata]|uniref:Rx, N-terminal n=1 Tax=Dillenia turbinata TaxID=194707 RepID=A0AAN8Z8H8_9MAGN